MSDQLRADLMAQIRSYTQEAVLFQTQVNNLDVQVEFQALPNGNYLAIIEQDLSIGSQTQSITFNGYGSVVDEFVIRYDASGKPISTYPTNTDFFDSVLHELVRVARGGQ